MVQLADGARRSLPRLSRLCILLLSASVAAA
jgi:hypothetical protein